MIVPPLAPLPAELVSEHAAAHEAVAEAWVRVEPLHGVARRLLRRILLESHANLQPVRTDPNAVLLAPPPRAFLTAGQAIRLEAAAAAFDHVEALQVMCAAGHRPSPLEPWTPMVLNAIIESRRPTGIEANAGLLRAGETRWLPGKNPMRHPAPHQVGELVAAAIDLATRAPAPAIARAGWLAFTFLSIHPFLDGNGRTARMLFQALASDEVPLGADWGAVEQFSIHRDGYVESLRAGQSIDEYDPTRLDPAPFVEFAARCSIAGVGVTIARLRALMERWSELGRGGLSPAEASAVLTAQIDGPIDLASIAEVTGESEPVALVNRLLSAGRLAWAPVPASRRAIREGPRHGLVAAAPA